MAQVQNFFFSACLHSDKEYFIEGVIRPPPQTIEVLAS